MLLLSLRLIVPLFAVFTFHQKNRELDSQNCESVKAGTFYFYPSMASESFVMQRTGSFQYEKNLKNGIASKWMVNWIDECDSTQRYLLEKTKNVEY